MLQLTTPLVSVNWLKENQFSEDLIIFNATISKVTADKGNEINKKQIPNAVFFDLKGVFLDKEGAYPNTFPKEKYFETQVQNLGVHQNSCIVVYDELGIYASARVWWLFKTYGFHNIAVLDGGFPAWEQEQLLVEDKKEGIRSKGDFKANLNPEKVFFTKQVLSRINDQNYCIVDARSRDRFYAKVKEPREGVRGGHIPNSFSLPYTELQHNGKMKSKKALLEIFNSINSSDKTYIFSCGTGITACILALGLEITGQSNFVVYDGSWTAWGSIVDLPIEK